MVKGIEHFKRYFRDYADQYVLIGDAACDISFGSFHADFRATRDLDVVLIVEALTISGGYWRTLIFDGAERRLLFDVSQKGCAVSGLS